jgi:hypothetical protein
MESAVRHLIEALHQVPCKYVLAITGGGTSAAAQLLAVPGASRTVLEVTVPYHEPSLADYLGYAPEQYCSAATTRLLARRAWERAAWLVPREPVLGLGCTASLASDRPKRGDHRFHVAVETGQRSTTYSLTLSKGARDREGEEAVVATVILNSLAEHVGVAERVPVPLLAGEEVLVETSASAPPLTALLHGERGALCVEIDGRLRTDAPRPLALLPGSFNPLHEGHCHLAAVARGLLGVPVAFELSVTNADKPPLTFEVVEQRRRQFAWKAPLWLTNAPTFAEKATLFPGTTFVVGTDTAERIVAPRFYQDSEERMTAALVHLRISGCRFLVAGRVGGQGRFMSCEELALPPAFRDLFRGIPAEAFRDDISSTLLRSSGH